MEEENQICRYNLPLQGKTQKIFDSCKELIMVTLAIAQSIFSNDDFFLTSQSTAPFLVKVEEHFY